MPESASEAELQEGATATPEAKTRASPLLAPQSLFNVRRMPRFETRLVDIAGGGSAPSVEVEADDVGALGEFLRRHLHKLVVDSSVPESDRAWACLHVLRCAVEQFHADEKAGGASLRTASDEMGTLLASVAPMSVLPAHWPSADGDLVERAVDTAFFAGVLAAAVGLGERRGLAAVVLAGALADAGKLELAPGLLESPSPLNERDWELVRWHPHHSVERMRVAGISDPAVLRGVIAHHEWWSGGGYPYGLDEKGIPVEARYVAIADAFSALCVDRPFRERHSVFDALTEMAKSGQFEPRLVRALVLLLKSDEADVSDGEDGLEEAKGA